jgi:hypothetical protein
MTETRTTREYASRERTKRPQAWQPASGLPEPDKQPGYDYRWIRVSASNQADAKNVSSKFREGWEPVRIEEQPELGLIAEKGSRFQDGIEVGGLLLCKIPTDFMEQRRKYYSRINQSQSDSVDNNFMREQDPRMPLFSERKSKTTFGTGR